VGASDGHNTAWETLTVQVNNLLAEFSSSIRATAPLVYETLQGGTVAIHVNSTDILSPDGDDVTCDIRTRSGAEFASSSCSIGVSGDLTARVSLPINFPVGDTSADILIKDEGTLFSAVTVDGKLQITLKVTDGEPSQGFWDKVGAWIEAYPTAFSFSVFCALAIIILVAKYCRTEKVKAKSISTAQRIYNILLEHPSVPIRTTLSAQFNTLVFRLNSCKATGSAGVVSRRAVTIQSVEADLEVFWESAFRCMYSPAHDREPSDVAIQKYVGRELLVDIRDAVTNCQKNGGISITPITVLQVKMLFKILSLLLLIRTGQGFHTDAIRKDAFLTSMFDMLDNKLNRPILLGVWEGLKSLICCRCCKEAESFSPEVRALHQETELYLNLAKEMLVATRDSDVFLAQLTKVFSSSPLRYLKRIFKEFASTMTTDLLLVTMLAEHAKSKLKDLAEIQKMLNAHPTYFWNSNWCFHMFGVEILEAIILSPESTDAIKRQAILGAKGMLGLKQLAQSGDSRVKEKALAVLKKTLVSDGNTVLSREAIVSSRIAVSSSEEMLRMLISMHSSADWVQGIQYIRLLESILANAHTDPNVIQIAYRGVQCSSRFCGRTRFFGISALQSHKNPHIKKAAIEACERLNAAFAIRRDFDETTLRRAPVILTTPEIEKALRTFERGTTNPLLLRRAEVELARR
jgi:hypothetical protein